MDLNRAESRSSEPFALTPGGANWSMANVLSVSQTSHSAEGVSSSFPTHSNSRWMAAASRPASGSRSARPDRAPPGPFSQHRSVLHKRRSSPRSHPVCGAGRRRYAFDKARTQQEHCQGIFESPQAASGLSRGKSSEIIPTLAARPPTSRLLATDISAPDEDSWWRPTDADPTLRATSVSGLPPIEVEPAPAGPATVRRGTVRPTTKARAQIRA
jgi:hypothetical protein